MLYSYQAWTSRCLFNRFGQCEGLYEWNSNVESSTFCFYCRLHIIILLTTESGTIGLFYFPLGMDKNMNNEELQTRRQFFKKSARSILPIIGFMAFGPISLSSCGGGDDIIDPSCSGCTNTCSSKCSSNCGNSCEDSCVGASVSTPCSSCASSCSGTCNTSCENTSTIVLGDGTAEAPYTVSQAIEVANDQSKTDNFYIRGKISNAINYLLGTTRIFYISDGEKSLYVYKCLNIGSVEFKDGEETNVGDEVVIYGYLRKSGKSYDIWGTPNPYVYKWLKKEKIKELSISPADGKIDGYEYVDLGLSIKWARYNVGASVPQKYGSYNYVNVSGTGYYNNTSICGSSEDNVTNKWSNKWKLPTKNQLEELINNCTFELGQNNGVAGVKVTSKVNGKSIFFPSGGYRKWYDKKWTTECIELGIWIPSGDIRYSYYSYISCLLINMHPTSLNSRFVDIEISCNKLNLRGVTTGSSGGGTSCNGNCTGNTTSTTCSSCASNCTGNCKTECSYNCAATCSGNCGGGCNDTCGGTCTYLSAGTGCSGCARTCNMRCYHACNYACSDNCQSSCVHGTK